MLASIAVDSILFGIHLLARMLFIRVTTVQPADGYYLQRRPLAILAAILDVFREQGLSRQVDASMAPAAVWEKVKALFEAENLA